MHYLGYTCNWSDQIFIFLKPLWIKVFFYSYPYIYACSGVYLGKEFWVVHTRFYNYLFIYKHSSSSLLSIIFTNVQDIGGLLSLTKMREIDPYKCTNGIPKSCLLEPKLALTLTAWVVWMRNVAQFVLRPCKLVLKSK